MSLTPISRRIAAAALAAALFFGMIPVNTAHAETAGPCEHLPAHQEGCNYAPATEEVPCGCPADENGVQTHLEDGACTYVAAAEEVPCTCTCPDCAAAASTAGLDEADTDSTQSCTQPEICADGIHAEGCDLYIAPTCSALEGCGEDAHNVDCALYATPAVPETVDAGAADAAPAGGAPEQEAVDESSAEADNEPGVEPYAADDHTTCTAYPAGDGQWVELTQAKVDTLAANAYLNSLGSYLYLSEDVEIPAGIVLTWVHLCLHGHNLTLLGRTWLGGDFVDCSETSQRGTLIGPRNDQIEGFFATTFKNINVDAAVRVDTGNENDFYIIDSSINFTSTHEDRPQYAVFSIMEDLHLQGNVTIAEPGLNVDGPVHATQLTGGEIHYTTTQGYIELGQGGEDRLEFFVDMAQPEGFRQEVDANGRLVQKQYIFNVTSSVANISFEGGEEVDGVYKAEVGKTVVINSMTAGRMISSFKYKEGTGAEKSATGNSFTMPEANVTITSVVLAALPTLTITGNATASGPGVTGTSSPYPVTPNTAVTLTPTEGYKITEATLSNGTTVNVATDGTSATFTMPASDVTVTVTTAPLVSYTIVIPTSPIEIGKSSPSISVTTTDPNKPYNGKLSVMIKSEFKYSEPGMGPTENNAFGLGYSTDYVLYDLTLGDVKMTHDVATVFEYSGTPLPLNFTLRTAPKFAGTYTGTLTFTVELVN